MAKSREHRPHHSPYLDVQPGTFGEPKADDDSESLAKRFYVVDKKGLRDVVDAIERANPELETLVERERPVYLPFLDGIQMVPQPRGDIQFNYVPPPDLTIPEEPELDPNRAPEDVPGATASVFEAETTTPAPGGGVTTARNCKHRITKVFRYGSTQEQEILMGREVFVRLEEISSTGFTVGPVAFEKPIARFCVYMAQRYRIRRWQLRFTSWKHEVVCGPPNPFNSTGYGDVPGSETWVQLPTLEVRRNAEEVRCFWSLVTASSGEAKAFADSLGTQGVIRGTDEVPF